jgi:hypothetical protein
VIYNLIDLLNIRLGSRGKAGSHRGGELNLPVLLHSLNVSRKFPESSLNVPYMCTQAAHQIGGQVGSEFNLPVLLYGSAHTSGRRLADIRRSAGYFKGSAGGLWEGQFAFFFFFFSVG